MIEGVKVEGPITIRVPYTKSNGRMYDLLKRYSDEIDAGADSTDSVYTVWGLRVTEIVQALYRAEGSLALQMQYPNSD